MRKAPFIHKRGSEIQETIEELDEDSPADYHEGRLEAINWVRDGDDGGFRSNEEIFERMESERSNVNQMRYDIGADDEEHPQYERSLGWSEELRWILKVEEVSVNDDQVVYNMLDSSEAVTL